MFNLSFCGVPITENLLKETAARSPVKLLFCWADQPNKKYILTGACAHGEWRLGAFFCVTEQAHVAEVTLTESQRNAKNNTATIVHAVCI